VPRCGVTATMMFSRNRNVKEPGRDRPGNGAKGPSLCYCR